MIGNISSSTGILILQGENDTQIPVQQAFLLQQRLTNVNHPDVDNISQSETSILSFISVVESDRAN